MDRGQAFERISEKLGSQQLIWVGYHGLDAGSLLELPQFSHCFSFGMALGAPQVQDFSVENQFNLRKVNQTSWGYNLASKAISDPLLKACELPTTIATFVPLPFIQTVVDERPLSRYLGMSWDSFQTFNSKATVERELRAFTDDVAFVDWQVLPNDASRTESVAADLRKGPIVLRSSFSQSGMGHELIRDEDELARSRLINDESLAIGPFLEDHIPLNLGACVFPDGEVTIHCPSFQLVGLPQCSKSIFGYCGNDFAAIKQLDRGLIESLEVCAKAVGAWLHSKGYVGVFGLDTMIYEGKLLYTELNPRFQGSTRVLIKMDAELGLPDIVQDHLMAWLGVESHESPPLWELVAAQPSVVQTMVFNKGTERVHVSKEALDRAEGVRAELVPNDNVLVDPGEMMFALIAESPVTLNGRSLIPAAAAVVDKSLTAVESRGRALRQRRSGAGPIGDRLGSMLASEPEP